MRRAYNPHTLIAWRKAQGMSQTEFGARLGYSRPHVARIESGRQFSIKYILQAASLCGHDYTEALTEDTLKKFARPVFTS